MSNSTNKHCLTIDTRDINDLGAAKFRTHADKNKEKFGIIIETKETRALILSCL